MSIFAPKEKLNIYSDLDIPYYRKKGFEMVLLDIDNTIAIPNTGSCDEKAAAFIKDLQDNGFKVVIFSNNIKERVKMFVGDLDVSYKYMALKPLPFSFRLTCRKYQVAPSKTLVLGDQLLTDMLGANLSGCYGIYCRQLQKQDSKTTAFNRHFEKWIWRHILHEKV